LGCEFKRDLPTRDETLKKLSSFAKQQRRSEKTAPAGLCMSTTCGNGLPLRRHNLHSSADHVAIILWIIPACQKPAAITS
jgi:pyridoxine/pyridoxamine 5'-phosphate oxidase